MRFLKRLTAPAQGPLPSEVDAYIVSVGRRIHDAPLSADEQRQAIGKLMAVRLALIDLEKKFPKR